MRKILTLMLVVLLVTIAFAAGACKEENTVMTEEQARQLAEDFVRNSPTFAFDGIENTLELVDKEYIEEDNTYLFTFQFESAHAGYGDRTGQMLAQVITPHEAIITVSGDAVISAIMDGVWDMKEQKMLKDIEVSLAPIHEVDVLFLESYPVQVMVQIKGGLRDGCTTLHGVEVERADDTVTITVTTQRPKDAYCPAVYTYFEENVNIGTDFTSGTTYTVRVNDYTTTFVYP